MSAVDALTVASAALAEVGIDPRIRWSPTHERLAIPSDLLRRHPIAYRAGLLGLMAEHGPDFRVRCRRCIVNAVARGTQPCTPVRDALRDVTCGGAA